jgi:hypothetical protein
MGVIDDIAAGFIDCQLDSIDGFVAQAGRFGGLADKSTYAGQTLETTGK